MINHNILVTVEIPLSTLTELTEEQAESIIKEYFQEWAEYEEKVNKSEMCFTIWTTKILSIQEN